MGSSHWLTHVGSSFCPECGGGPVTETPPALWHRFVRWLEYGERVGPILTCAEGHSWPASSFATMRLAGRPWVSKLWRAPLTLFRMVREGRGLVPTPLTYLMAIALGVVLGVVLDILSPVRWWLVAVLVVSAIWLFYMSTAFWGPHRLRRYEVVRRMNPTRAQEEAHEDLTRAVRDGELRAYALARWTGRASIGGWGRGHRGWHTISLRFDDPADERRWVEVESIIGSRGGPPGLRKEILADNLVGQIPDLPPFGSIEEAHAWHTKRRHDYETRIANLAWDAMQLSVDGATVDAETARIDDGIAVVARHGRGTIEILARNVDAGEIALVAVSDLQPYVDAARRSR